ncbi:hypothetical protein GCM10009601_46980 [Streptomyces thermospinosisporus]|uniref:Uncharacterized protein n=1 Tax=Streptomyces thermospinosisporus TaxID=161482 RepID=A0ABP4JU83_9ACTN
MLHDLGGPAEDVGGDGADDADAAFPTAEEFQGFDHSGVRGAAVVTHAPRVPERVPVEGDADLQLRTVPLEQVQPGVVELEAVGLEAHADDARLCGERVQDLRDPFPAGGQGLPAVEFDAERTPGEDRTEAVDLCGADPGAAR